MLGTALAQGANCTVALTFQPGAVGARSATLQVVSSGTNPPDIALSGNGSALAAPAAEVVPAALNFSVPAAATSVEAQIVTLQSTGNAVLHVNGIRIASGSFTLLAASTNACPATPFDLMPGQACALAVGWSNPTQTADSGILEFDTNAAAAPLQVSLQAAREMPASANPAAPSISNVGAGGCSIARGETPADPTLWLLMLLAGAVLLRRRCQW